MANGSKKRNRNKNKNKNKNKSKNKEDAGCAACDFFGQDCPQDCPSAPYFPANDPQRFAVVHKIFGTHNFEAIMKALPENRRAEAAESMVNDANARERDGIYGLRASFFGSSQSEIDAARTLANFK